MKVKMTDVPFFNINTGEIDCAALVEIAHDRTNELRAHYFRADEVKTNGDAKVHARCGHAFGVVSENDWRMRGDNTPVEAANKGQRVRAREIRDNIARIERVIEHLQTVRGTLLDEIADVFTADSEDWVKRMYLSDERNRSVGDVDAYERDLGDC